jgi:hypothetical protein
MQDKKKGLQEYKWIKGENPGINKKKKIPPGAWMSVSFECCVLTGRGLCDGLVIRPEEF